VNLSARAGVKINIDLLNSDAEPFGGGLSSFTSKTDWMVTNEVSIDVLLKPEEKLTFSATLAKQG
jgi:hypothetical protein